MPITHMTHPWQVRRDTGITVYEECPQCRRRQAWQRGVNPDEPVDVQWVQGGGWSDETPPHQPFAAPHPQTGEPIDAFQAQRRQR